MSKHTDSQLWNRLKQGDHAALELIYRNEMGFLYNYGKKLNNDATEVEDAIQELFIELWEKREGLSDTDHIRPYLTVAIKRKLVRKIQKRQKTQLYDNDEDIIKQEIIVDSIHIRLDEKHPQSKLVADAIQQLSKRQQEIIYLKYYGGMDYEEIAEIMDMNYQSARNLVSRAITAMSKKLSYILFYIFIYVGMSTNL